MRLLIIYGSQKGCAASIAKRIDADAKSRGLETELVEGNKYKKLKPPLGSTERSHLVVVTSTTGNGDPPDNFDRFL